MKDLDSHDLLLASGGEDDAVSSALGGGAVITGFGAAALGAGAALIGGPELVAGAAVYAVASAVFAGAQWGYNYVNADGSGDATGGSASIANSFDYTGNPTPAVEC